MTNDDKRTLTAQGGQLFYHELYFDLAHASQPPLQPASLADALGVRPGITAIIGSGGKTSLLRSLSRELSHELPSEVSREMPCEQARQLSHESSHGRSGRGSRILLTTTTHILPFQDLPCLRVSSEETLEVGFYQRIVTLVYLSTPNSPRRDFPCMSCCLRRTIF